MYCFTLTLHDKYALNFVNNRNQKKQTKTKQKKTQHDKMCNERYFITKKNCTNFIPIKNYGEQEPYQYMFVAEKRSEKDNQPDRRSIVNTKIN